MRLSEPSFLLLLLLIIPLWRFSRQQSARIRYSNIDAVRQIGPPPRFSPRSVLLCLRILAALLFVLALARPQSGKKFTEIPSEGIDIMMAVDTSGSMMGLDFKIDGKPVPRLEVVKQVATDFVKQRPGDRIGIVVFGEEAYTQCPLTLDHGIVVDFLSQLKAGMAGDATAIGSGLGTAVNRMKNLKTKSKVVILLTDGSNNAGRIPPLKAAEIAASFGIRVYTIGAGSKGKVPFLVNTPFGSQYIYQEADLDEETLMGIAKQTGAQYFRATDTRRLQETYKEIDALEKSEARVKEFTEYHELFAWFVIPALLCLLSEIILSQTRLRKIP